MKNKKGVIDQLTSMITPIIVIAIVLVVGFLILSQARTQINTIEGTCNSTEGGFGCNATIEVQNALDDIPQWLPIIIITIIGALLISLVAVFRRS